MKKIILLFLMASLYSCGGYHKVTHPMANMPIKWRPYFQEMAIVTYKEYSLKYDKETAIKLTNQKIGLIILKTSEKNLQRMEEYSCRENK